MSEPAAARLPPRRRGALLLGLALAALLGGAALAYRHLRPAPPAPAGPAADDPRLTFDTPYRNVRPGVRYVGDAVCAECHPEVAASYRKHPMGRSFARASAPGAGATDPAAATAFEALGFHYRVERPDGHVVHRETRRDDKGKVVAERAAEVDYVIGSGAQGYTYLLATDGYVFQSPISWYARQKRYDLSPGYHKENQHFERPVGVECLFCHTNHVAAVPNTANRFRLADFRAEPVGCERCHGPGELHVRAPAGGPNTIVNPKHLAPALREAVCQQCHLQGHARVLRRGRQVFDYRPGLPLQLFWSVFTWRPGAADVKAVGQVEQMYQSKCFRASGGQLGCTSCHDPHAKPAPAAAAAHYRARCLKCHQEKDCALRPAERRRQQKDDSCVACHMPRVPTQTVHLAATDHRVPRRPGAAGPAAPRLKPGEAPLVPFHAGLPGPGAREVERDLGLGLVEMGASAGAAPARAGLGALALPRLARAVEDVPDDVAAWEGKGQALRYQGRPAEALAAFEAALAHAADREVSLAEAALVAAHLKRTDEAVRYWRRALAINPRRAHYHRHLAEALYDRHEREEALAECRQSLELNPAGTDARLIQVGCLLELGRKAEARAAFEALMTLGHPRKEELRRWFDAHSR